MTADELARVHTERWPRPSELSNRQFRSSTRHWGEENAGIELNNYTREQAREYGLRYPSRIKFLRAMLNDAKRDGLVSENVFSALRITKPRRERYFPSEDEVQALIRAAEEPLRGRIRFSAYTGLRLGEMLAVRPCDLVLDHSQRETLGISSGENDEPRFRIRVFAQINALEERVGLKGRIKDFWAIVPAEAHLGLPLLAHADQDRLWPLSRYEHNKEWNALRKRLDLPENFVWHSLRHHAATWFLDQGASFEDVAIQLGHDDEGVQVRETYGHRDRNKALDRLEAVVGG